MVEVYDIIRKLDNFVVMCKHGTNEYVTYYTDGSSTSDTEHEYVDLGLPSGLKWATCNIGADSPEDYGYYFLGEEQNRRQHILSKIVLSRQSRTYWKAILKDTVNI